MQDYLNLRLEKNQQVNNCEGVVEKFYAEARNGGLICYTDLRGQKAPVAMATVDMAVGRLPDEQVLQQYIARYRDAIYKQGNGRIINDLDLDDPQYTTVENTAWQPARVLSCEKWCRIHYDEDLTQYAFLKSFVVDPLFLQFKEDILDYFMDACGVNGFLL